MGERINKALYKVEEKKQKRAARRAQVSIREVRSGLVEGIAICYDITISPQKFYLMVIKGFLKFLLTRFLLKMLSKIF